MKLPATSCGGIQQNSPKPLPSFAKATEGSPRLHPRSSLLRRSSHFSYKGWKLRCIRQRRITPLFTPCMVYNLHMSDTPNNPAKATESPAAEPVAKVRKEIPLIAIQDDGDMIAEEMAAMFDEDRVSHQHGGTEPEAD